MIDSNLVDNLSNSKEFVGPVNIDGENREILKNDLRMMMMIRSAEEKIGDMVASGKIKCPCHLGIGQEAIPVGVARHLRKSDRVFGAHRSHPHFLATGGGVRKLFDEVLGRVTGCSKGMGGSMHVTDVKNGFYGSVPIVAATISVAVGAGLAAKMDNKGDVGVTYFGDGSAEEGSLHESLNIASIFKIPTLFICENNLFASHLHISQRQVRKSIARFAESHSVPFEIVDGNDIVQVSNAAERLLQIARNGNGPVFLEAFTYRHRGHVGPREDIDVGVMRKDDLNLWKKRDPILRLSNSMIDCGYLTKEQLKQQEHDVDSLIEKMWQESERAPFPDESMLMDMVYSKGGNNE